MKHLVNHLFSTKFPITILFVIIIFGCSTTSTIVKRKHHLLNDDPTSTSVCFLREKGGGNVYGKLLEIKLDGELLLELNKGQYTYLPIKSGKYKMMITSWTSQPGDSVSFKTSRNFVLDLAEADSVNLFFALEKMTFGQVMNHALKQFIDTIGEEVNQKIESVSIPISKDFAITPFQRESTLEDRSKGKSHSGRGYTCEIINSSRSKEIESELTLIKIF